MSSARSVSYGMNSRRLQCVVETDLLGGHRLDLDALHRPECRLHDLNGDAVGVGRVDRPVDVTAGRGAGSFELQQILVQMIEGVLADARCPHREAVASRASRDDLGALWRSRRWLHGARSCGAASPRMDSRAAAGKSPCGHSTGEVLIAINSCEAGVTERLRRQPIRSENLRQVGRA